MMSGTVFSRVLVRASEITGGPEQLAAQLGISPMLVRAFMTGKVVPPQRLFLKVVDIVSGHDALGGEPPRPAAAPTGSDKHPPQA